MVKKKFYITTAIDYVNASPHIGHAFEKVLADAIARWHKLQDEDVFFLTGVDENAQKNVQAAQKSGVGVKEFIDNNAKLFLKLCDNLNINYDKFIRTTAREHFLVVHKFLKKMLANKDIYKGSYEGFYCSGCETYITEKDLVDGKCPEHNKEPEHIKQEAYFFKLSKYKKELIKFIEKYIIPESKKKEILSRLNGELKDVCITRKDAEWGIDFPEDKNYKVWVWIDALINYISGAEKKWPADLHVVGKGINWFHSVIWPAMLMSAKYKLPKNLLVHGYVNIGGKKMSKSLGNVIAPLELIEKYGCDSVRYSLLKGSTFEDFDYSEEVLIDRNNDELANKLGNLISRVSALIEKNGIQKITKSSLNSKKILLSVKKHFEKFELDKALNEIFAFIDLCNEYVQKKKPWETKDKKVLYELAVSIKDLAILLWPFIPSTSEKIAKQFGFEINLKNFGKPLKIQKIKKGEILFKKIEMGENSGKQTSPTNPRQNKARHPLPDHPPLNLKNENIQNHKNCEIAHPPLKTEIKIQQNKNLQTKSQEKINKPEKIIEGIIKMTTIEFSEWEKLELRIAEIKKVEDIEGADKLYKLSLDVGKFGQRIVCAGLKEYYSKKDLLGKKVIYFSNLKPRLMRGIESSGMILAAVSEDHKKVSLIFPDKAMENGSRVS